MNKEKVSNIGFSSLIFFPILALFSGIGTHNTIKIAEVDSYISVLLAYLLGFIPLLLFMLIFNYKKELSIVDKIKYLFGTTLGTIINFLPSFSATSAHLHNKFFDNPWLISAKVPIEQGSIITASYLLEPLATPENKLLLSSSFILV